MEAWSSVNEEREGQGDGESERWRVMLLLCFVIGPQVSDCAKVEGSAADWHLPNCLIYQRLWGISSTCWFVKANKHFHVLTDNNMFVTLSPVSYGGNWSSCQIQRDESLQGITVVVILRSEIESITRGPIIIVVSRRANMNFDKRWGIPHCGKIITTVN